MSVVSFVVDYTRFYFIFIIILCYTQSNVIRMNALARIYASKNFSFLLVLTYTALNLN